MPTSQALRLCPSLQIIQGRHQEYSRISRRLYERMCTIAPAVERASIDEMNMDFTGCENLYGNDLPGFMKTIQQMVQNEFRLPCSIALASNTTVAKIAVNQVKPNGVTFIPHGSEAAYLAPLAIDVLPGIGKKTGERLREHGYKTVGDLQRASERSLVSLLGKFGIWIYRAAQGHGRDVIGEEEAAKSISRDETFPSDIDDIYKLEHIARELTEDVCTRLRAQGFKARTVSIKLRYADFQTITHAETLSPTNDDALIAQVVSRLLHAAYTRELRVRLLGVRLSNFDTEEQLELSLFPSDQKKQEILRVVDGLKQKFGKDVIHVGGTEKN
jgi:DNA polymerase-4